MTQKPSERIMKIFDQRGSDRNEFVFLLRRMDAIIQYLDEQAEKQSVEERKEPTRSKEVRLRRRRWRR